MQFPFILLLIIAVSIIAIWMQNKKDSQSVVERLTRDSMRSNIRKLPSVEKSSVEKSSVEKSSVEKSSVVKGSRTLDLFSTDMDKPIALIGVTDVVIDQLVQKYIDSHTVSKVQKNARSATIDTKKIMESNKLITKIASEHNLNVFKISPERELSRYR